MERIFLVEDGLSLISGLSFAIRKQGYELEITRTCLEAEALWVNRNYDLVILDVSLPDGSGYDLYRRVRQTSTVPIMFLTTADEKTNITMGLDIGGDDYITEPFKLTVFLSRINTLSHKSDHFSQPATELTSNGITVDRLKSEIYRNGQLLDLAAGEYKLLYLFMEHPDIVLSPEQILGRLWDYSDSYIGNNTLIIYIRRLRTKIENHPGDPKRIVAVQRIGYEWSPMD